MDKTEVRKALPVHHTPTSDTSWDGPAAKANLKLDQDAAYYQEAFAWQDLEGDPKTKAAYKFINHEVDADGTIGAANITACRAGIAVLNGGRGGTTIPDTDRQGVYNHLAAHLKDADLEPPELKSFVDEKIERRTVPCEYREGDGVNPMITGHAAVFDTATDIGGWFSEIIAKGAFKQAIKRDDVRALWNHDENYVLGRTPKTLRLAEDEKGLAVEIDVPQTQLIKDMVLTPMQRGDVNQMSFAFQVTKEAWDQTDPKNLIRTIQEVKLFDVSPVTYPAYPTTDCAVRSGQDVLNDYRASKEILPVVLPEPEHTTPTSVLREKLRLAELEWQMKASK
jgi:HK97 family phage prohead protease